MKKAIKNYLTQLRENEEKGFSLVELIIVMAIMAILVGVVASQVIPYMEKSRQSKDQQQLSEIATAMVSAVAESPLQISDIPNTRLNAMTDNAGASGSNIGSNLANLLEADATQASLSSIETKIVGKFKSKKFKAASGITISYDATNGKTWVFVGSSAKDGDKSTVVSD